MISTKGTWEAKRYVFSWDIKDDNSIINPTLPTPLWDSVLLFHLFAEGVHTFFRRRTAFVSFRPLLFRQPHSIFQGGPSAHCLFVCPRGRNGYRKKSQHKSWPWRRNFSRRRSCRDSNLRLFDHESGALPLSYHLPSPITPTSDSGQISLAPRRNRTCIRGALESTLKQQLHSRPSKINQKGRN